MGSRRKLAARFLPFLLVLHLLPTGCTFFSNVSPVVLMTASRTRGSIPLDVEFDASASYDPDGRITRWAWDFGDGERERGATVTHRFLEPGVYQVRLSVRDNRGTTSNSSVLIEVAEFNQSPIAEMVCAPQTGEAPLLVVFDGSGSSDEDGWIEGWSWDFGDGQVGYGSTASYRYSIPGTYTVVLTVTDDLLAEASVEREVVVSAPGPFVRRFRWKYAGREIDWTMSIPSELYYEYRSRLRGLWGDRDYDEYVLDPLDDAYLESLVDWIQSQVGTDFYTTVECAFNFVQGAIDYTYDRSGFEYPRYPIETLVDETGDCEDTAILYASLVRTLGTGAMLVAVDTNHDGTVDHMITLVPVSQAYADTVPCTHGCISSFWTYDSQLYAFAETTGEPDLAGYYFQLGCDPWGLTAVDFKITWDVSSLTPKIMPQRWEPSPASGE